MKGEIEFQPPTDLTKTTYAVFGEWVNGWYEMGERNSLEEAMLMASGPRNDCLNVAVLKVSRDLIEVTSAERQRLKDFQKLHEAAQAVSK